MAKGKKHKDPRKYLRMACPSCAAEQESIRVQCKQCGNDLHPDLDSEILATVRGNVQAFEEAYKEVKDPGKGNPYAPIDRAVNSLKRLYRHREFPGMADFIDHAGKLLLPYELKLMQRTLTANMVLLMMLVLFALVPLMVGWPPIIAGVMALPVVGWGVIAFKAFRQFNAVKKKVNALDGE